jgi:hypothetical protein
MSVRTKNLKLVGVGSAVALTIGAIAAPALAATKDVVYTCTTLGPTSATFNYGTIMPTMVAGQTDKHAMSQVIHLTAAQGAVAKSFGDSVSGTLKAKGANGTMPFKMTIPSTPLNGGAQDIDAAGNGTIMPTKAGTRTVSLGDMTATLVLSKSGSPDTTVPASCTAPTDGTQNLGTVTVTKDKSKTVVVAGYNATKDKATGTATVKGKTYQLPGTGKVKFTLKKGSTVKATDTEKLNAKGKATAVFKNVKKAGTYTIKASFGGDKGLKGSSGSDTFTVK